MRAAGVLLAVAIALTGIGPATSAQAREALGMFDNWGAFREAKPLRCFAIAVPLERGKGKWHPFAAVSHWPDSHIRGQFHVRLSRERQGSAAVTLTIADARLTLLPGRFDAWAANARDDAIIVAKMRAARSMSISSVDANGRAFADSYLLKGAATAIDAAALGCVQP